MGNEKLERIGKQETENGKRARGNCKRDTEKGKRYLVKFTQEILNDNKKLEMGNSKWETVNGKQELGIGE